MDEQIRIVLVGGGSGGHFYPLLAVAEELRSRPEGANIGLYYFGPNAYNQNDLHKHNVKHVYVPAGKQRKYFSLLNYLDVFKIFFGIPVAIFHLFRLYPDVVFSKGSYTSVPVTLAAWILRIPIVIHESDTKPGRANLFAAKKARYIGIGFPEVADFFPKDKTALVGIPTRKALQEPISDPHKELKIPSDKPIIFVTGGSLGAKRINELILESLDELLPHYTILHQAGSDHATTVRQIAAEILSDQTLLQHYFVTGTLKAQEMQAAHTVSALTISRAGASSIHEIALHSTPSIMIPIPEKISHDQRSNAYAYARTNAASVLEEDNLTDGLLTAEITRIMTNQDVYDSMVKAANSFAIHNSSAIIGATLLEIASEHV